MRNIDKFPLEVMDASLGDLLRVPGIGPVGARRIMAARKKSKLSFDDLHTLNITLNEHVIFLRVQASAIKTVLSILNSFVSE